MDQPIFQTRFFGDRCSIFADRIVLETLWGIGRRVEIPADKIATIETGGFFQPSVTVATTGDERFVIPAFFWRKKAIIRAIDQARSSHG